MSRCASVSMIKGTSKPLGQHPAAGTKLWLVYSMLYEYRGRTMPGPERQALNELVGENRYTVGRLTQVLENLYGCDIRNGILVGEWFGRIYVDYTAPAEEQARRLRFETAPTTDIAAARDALLGSRLEGTRALPDLAGSGSAYLG